MEEWYGLIFEDIAYWIKSLLMKSIEKQNSKDDVEYKEKIVMDHSYYEMHLYKV